MSSKLNKVSLIESTKAAFSFIFHPESFNEHYSVGDSIMFYYKAAIIPAIINALLYALMGFAFAGYISTMIQKFTGFLILPALGAIFGFIFGLIYLLILIPIGIIINSAIVHFFSKIIFRVFNKDFSRTVTAFTLSTFPLIFFVWVFPIPFLGALISIIIVIWEFIILIISMARQQEVSGFRAFGGIILPEIIFIIVFIITAFLISIL